METVLHYISNLSFSHIKPQEIEEKAQAVLNSCFPEPEDLTLPVSLSTILRKYSFKVKYVNFTEKGTVGVLDKQTIFVEKNLSETDQKLTIAHELGQCFINDLEAVVTTKGDLRVNDSIDATEAIRAANLFATALLMPQDIVFQLWQKAGNVHLMAEVFMVDESVMLWRLYKLGIIYDPLKKFS